MLMYLSKDKRWTYLLIVFLLFLGISNDLAFSQQSTTDKHLFEGQIAPLLDGMGNHHFDISTDDTLAQEFFN